ncbi:hypothetical protein M9Y10_008942 [Tritrichomonas musculus]|uniref:Uncharacterized protein n=1 Tax=Tritrichomonas musculus TaxID=1915356 RepID=A0ABR2IZQ5_9EUKA
MNEFRNDFSINQKPKTENLSLLRLNETARKIQQIEENQINQLQNQIQSKQQEIDKLSEELTKYKLLKEEKKKKILELDQVLLSSLAKIHENSDSIDPEIISLHEQNSSYVKNLSAYINNEEEVNRIQKLADSLETELFEYTEKRAILNDDPENNINHIKMLKENKDILKKQINQMEDYIRNTFRFERDESKSKIKILKQNVSSLSRELLKIKDEQKDWNEHLEEKEKTESINLLISFCEELENEALVKEKDVEMLVEENKARKNELDSLKLNTSKIEAEISQIVKSLSNS